MKFRLLLLSLTAALLGAAIATTVDITGDKVMAAAEVLGIDFLDEEEIELMLPDLRETHADLDSIGKMELPNGLAPALIFSPVIDSGQLQRIESPLPKGTAPATPPPPRTSATDYAFMTVEELASLVYHKQVSSRELTEYFLDRLKKHDPTLHCVITLTEERALAQADRMDAELAAGNYRGYPTTWGAKPYRDQVIDMDAAVIGQLDAAGAVLCAKLTLGALAWGDVWYGEKTRNPWNPEEGSSGSSAGSASAVAAGLVPFAIGTETLGSIVSPSTVCGTTGLRPTFGRVSRHGAMALSWSMDKIGPITRSATDAGLVLEAISGDDARDEHKVSPPFAFSIPETPRPVRIGYYKSRMERDYPFKTQDSTVLETLRELGYELVAMELPEEPEIGFILNVEAAAAFETLTRSGDDAQLTRQIRNAWPNVFRAAHFVPAVAYVQANRLRSQLMHDMYAAFNEAEVDVYVNPSWHSNSLFITNMTGHPSITVPNGFNGEGTPTSVTFTGRLFHEQALVNIATAYQEETRWDDVHPEGF